MDFFEFEEIKEERNIKYLILIIYDISDNKQRLKLAKYLESYGVRVQKSAFEARLDKKKYKQLLEGLDKILNKEDNVRVYKMKDYEEVRTYGDEVFADDGDYIII